MGGIETMIYALAIQKIKDYNKWKEVFDEHGKVRKIKGSKGAIIYRNTKDPKQLVIITEWENMESAKNFSLSEDLKTTMKKAGVIGLPELHYLEEIEKTKY
ncbi:antibiotic biosynthesis monooxygenase [Methanobacterium sp.]|uniref:antibiotic biosynthesis monooxygenase n=1 Tax=Methanobacterium sp. TaxID=2164 RepID=UPI003C789823